ncbi:MAG: family 1 encapsulin nanocompartment shell protein [Magnetospirillum sp.]|nr:family 1 encapsulin nanocompartment shell protein [Magnetospirillum sp.]
MDPLNRALAPFGDDIWQAIEDTAVEAARAVLTARRFLPVEGPFGLGLTAIEAGSDDIAEVENPAEAVAILGAPLSVPMLWRGFGLSLRRLAAHREHGQPLDLAAVIDAASAMARLEERLIYHGDARAGLAGLLNAQGTLSVAGGDWSRIDQALKDVLAAVTALDDDGHSGPYALAAAPHLYNGLFRRYADSDLLQVDHLGRLCAAGIFKAAIPGAVIIDPRVGRLVVGQDLAAGFASLDGVHCRMFLSESLVLAIDDARAICRIVLEEA